MPDCPEFVIWRPIRSGSRLCGRVDANGTQFTIVVRGMFESGGGFRWNTPDLFENDICVDIPPNSAGVVHAAVLRTADVSVRLHLRVEGDEPHECDWTFGDPQPRATGVQVLLVPTE